MSQRNQFNYPIIMKLSEVKSNSEIDGHFVPPRPLNVLPSFSFTDLQKTSRYTSSAGHAARYQPTKLIRAAPSSSAPSLSFSQCHKRFSIKPGSENQTKLPNYQEMILGALRAGALYYPRGMKSGDILEIVYSVYQNIPKNQTSESILQRTLDLLVSRGFISRSFGVKASDATFRIVNTGLVKKEAETLVVTGRGIKPIPSIHHANIGHGLALPSGSSFQTRVPRASLTSQKQKLELPASLQRPMKINYLRASLTSKLDKSFAYRAGAIDELKPLKYIPNTPVPTARCVKNNWNDVDHTSVSQSSHDTWVYEEEDEGGNIHEVEVEAELTQRFEAYSLAVAQNNEEELSEIWSPDTNYSLSSFEEDEVNSDEAEVEVAQRFKEYSKTIDLNNEEDEPISSNPASKFSLSSFDDHNQSNELCVLNCPFADPESGHGLNGSITYRIPANRNREDNFEKEKCEAESDEGSDGKDDKSDEEEWESIVSSSSPSSSSFSSSSSSSSSSTSEEEESED